MKKHSLSVGWGNSNLKIEIHNYILSSHSWTSHKIITEPTGSIQILCKAHKYEHNTYSKNSISMFELKIKHTLV